MVDGAGLVRQHELVAEVHLELEQLVDALGRAIIVDLHDKVESEFNNYDKDIDGANEPDGARAPENENEKAGETGEPDRNMGTETTGGGEIVKNGVIDFESLGEKSESHLLELLGEFGHFAIVVPLIHAGVALLPAENELREDLPGVELELRVGELG